MKKFAPILILFLLVMVALDSLPGWDNLHYIIDGDDFDGPAGAVLAALFASGGVLVAVVVALIVVVVLALVCAGLGALAVTGAVLLAVMLALLASPLLLPLLTMGAIFWYLLRRDRRKQGRHTVQASEKA